MAASMYNDGLLIYSNSQQMQTPIIMALLTRMHEKIKLSPWSLPKTRRAKIVIPEDVSSNKGVETRNQVVRGCSIIAVGYVDSKIFKPFIIFILMSELYVLLLN